MNKGLLVFLAVICMQSLVYGQLTIRDENAQLREAKNFHGINISGSFTVYLTQSNEEGVAVSSSDPKFMDRIKVDVREGILYIRVENGKWHMGNKRFKAYISCKNIDQLHIGGASNVVIQGMIKTEELKIDLSGASNLDVRLQVAKLSVNLSGASDMKARGLVTQLQLDANGASKFKGFDLSSDFCQASASGASDIKIRVNKELSIKASGASDIDYKGKGVIRDVKTSGASSVSRES